MLYSFCVSFSPIYIIRLFTMKLTYASTIVQGACLLPLLSLLSAAVPLGGQRALARREDNGPLASNTSSPQALLPASARPAAAAADAPPAAEADSPVPVGTVITSCTVPGTVALTFDDGPYIYTPAVLDTLLQNNIKATFFVNGQNWADINSADSQASVRRAIAEGHQVGSHSKPIPRSLRAVTDTPGLTAHGAQRTRTRTSRRWITTASSAR